MTSATAYVSDLGHSFSILKSNDLHIAGYASIEMVDKQNDLITLDALDHAVRKQKKLQEKSVQVIYVHLVLEDKH